MPLLGCGNGELSWPNVVKPLVEQYLDALPLHVFVHTLAGTNQNIPEHKAVLDTAAWLRAQPTDLSYCEVLRDLSALLQTRTEFTTFGHGKAFAAVMTHAGIRFTPGGLVSTDELLDFWHQLRTYGFTLPKFAAGGLKDRIQYLMPVFAELPYTRKVYLADDFHEFTSARARLGLQYIAPLVHSAEQQELEFA
jgi:hypothetical protein